MNNPLRQLPVTPRFMPAAVLLLWGWQTGFLPFALIMGLLLELAGWTRWRWSITDREFNQVADLSGVIFAAIVLYIFIREGSQGIFIILSLLPFILFLLLLVQTYSEAGKIKLSTLFISLRRADAQQLAEANREIDVSLPYILITLISASTGNHHPLVFFSCSVLLIGRLLWSCRSSRYSAGAWLLLLMLSLSLAYSGQYGLLRLQNSIEAAFMQIFDRYMWQYRNPDRTSTAIGSLGRLKLSDRIQLRIKTGERLTAPLYLLEGTYNHYGFGIWSNSKSKFTLIEPERDSKSWKLDSNQATNRAIISTYMISDSGIIPLPVGTGIISGNGIIEINRSDHDAVRMEIREGWISYAVDYRNDVLVQAPPKQQDVQIPDSYRSDFDRLARELELNDKTEQGKVSTVREFFSNNFYYSLEQSHRFPRGRYLSHFLFESRTGHCEFFATATVLLLRAAGIPARYAVGYAVDEYSRLEGQYLARARHAHSWVHAYIDGHWQLIDTTPSVWAPLEAEHASALQPLLDLWAWLRFKYSHWQTADILEKSEPDNSRRLLWLLIPLVGILAWRLHRKGRIQNNASDNSTITTTNYPGLDSLFYRLCTRLEQSGLKRQRGETLTHWIARHEHLASSKALLQALQLHYRYRFDPLGLPRQELLTLNELVSTALDEITPS